ncbi:MAG: uridine kinase [Ruminococcaceae bacterium]|nr:uridine kinase [Oscillospiraceae bacterium]
MQQLIIGIAGGSGSGKTTFAENLRNHFPDDALILNCDNYYKKRGNMSFEERQKINYDAPDSLDIELLLAHVKGLMGQSEIECPVYDFSRHKRSEKTVTISPKPIIIIDGILIFHYPELLKLIDIKIFVDVDSDVRLLRRLLRDVKERGRNLNDISRQYLETVKPMYDKYVEPTKAFADIIIKDARDTKMLGSVLSFISEKRGI